MYHDGNRDLQDRFDSRYIHRMSFQEMSEYAAAAGHRPPTPVWKETEAFRDYLPRPPAGKGPGGADD